MKKRFIAMVLVAAFALAFAFPTYVNVEVSALSTSDVVSEDPIVQSMYVQFVYIVGALGAYEYEILETSYYKLDDLLTQLDEKQEEEWTTVLEENVGLEAALSTLFDAAYIVDTITLMETYEKAPNALVAYEFVNAYDWCVLLGIDVNAFNGDVETLYDTAKTNDMPSDNAIAVYEAFVEVVYALEDGDPDDLDDAIECFEEVVDIYNNLTASEFEDVACLLDIKSEDPELTDGEYISQIIFADWMNINVLDSIDKAYNDFIDDSNMANAEALVGFYELIFPQDGEGDSISRGLALYFFPDLTEVYEQAKAVMTESDSSDIEGSEDSDIEDSESSDMESGESSDIEQSEASGEEESNVPDTGDDFGMQMWLVVILLSALAVGVAAKRTEQNK